MNVLVLIKKDNLPTMVWKMGRVVKLDSGSNNIIRLLTVKRSKEFVRPTNKLCILPLDREFVFNLTIFSQHFILMLVETLSLLFILKLF